MSWRAARIGAALIGAAGLLLAGGAIAARGAPVVLSLGQTESGALTEADPATDGGARYDDLFIALRAGERIEVLFDGGAFADLRLGAGSGRTFEAREVDAELSAGEMLRVRFTAPAGGRYTVRVAAREAGASGDYKITVRPYASAPAAVAQPIAPGETIESPLGNGGPRIGEQELPYGLFRLDAEAGARYAVRMRSTGFTSVLDLPGATTTSNWSENEDGGSAAIARFAAAEDGPQDIRIVALDPLAEGPIAIALERLPDPGPPPRTRMLRRGRVATGAFDGASATGDDFRPYAYYAVRGRPGETVTVRLASDDFDALLEAGAMTPAGFAVARGNDDDPEDGTNAKLALRFDRPGLLLLRASSASPGATGAYSLTIEE